jgi:hypothetical protein
MALKKIKKHNIKNKEMVGIDLGETTVCPKDTAILDEKCPLNNEEFLGELERRVLAGEILIGGKEDLDLDDE